jgi:micrococcal nuclease
MDLRSDIATAAARMASDYDVSREVRRLGPRLHGAETVQRLAAGLYGAGAGLLAVTDHQVMFLRDGRNGTAVESFPLGELRAAEWSPEGARATISVTDSRTTAVLRQVALGDARAVVELIHALAEGAESQESDLSRYDTDPSTESTGGYPIGGTGSYPVSAPPAVPGTGGYPAGGTGAHQAVSGTGGFGAGAHRSDGGSTGGGRHGGGSGYLPAAAASAPFGGSRHGEDRGPHGGAPEYGQDSILGRSPAEAMAGAGVGGGFLPGGRSLNGAGGPAAPAGSALPTSGRVLERDESASATTTTFNRPTDSGPGWGGVRGIPRPAGPGDTMQGAVPITALAATNIAPPLPPMPEPDQRGEQRTDHRQPVERSGPLGLAGSNLVGEVPITQLATEDFADGYPEPRTPDALDAGVAGTAGTAAVDPVPDALPDTIGDDAAAPEQTDGDERPKPINWKAPSKSRVKPLLGPKSHKKDGSAEETVAVGAAGSEPTGGTGAVAGPAASHTLTDLRPPSATASSAKRSRWVWMTAGAAALVGLATVGSIKLIGSGGDPAAPLSPAPAAAVDNPAGPTVQVAKVLAGDQVQVTGQYTGTVEVLGIVSPSGTSCGAAQAKQYAVDTLTHQTVALVSDSSQPQTDASGRRLAYLALPNHNDYSTQAAGAGMAKFFDGGNNLQNATQIKAAQSVAQEDKDGLWGPPCNGKFATSGSAASSTSSSGSGTASEGADGSADSSSTSGSSSTGSGSSSSESGTSHSSKASTRSSKSTHSSTESGGTGHSTTTGAGTN